MLWARGAAVAHTELQQRYLCSSQSRSRVSYHASLDAARLSLTKQMRIEIAMLVGDFFFHSPPVRSSPDGVLKFPNILLSSPHSVAESRGVSTMHCLSQFYFQSLLPLLRVLEALLF